VNFFDIFSKNTQTSNFMEMRPFICRRTKVDMTELKVAFHNFANGSKMISNMPLPIIQLEKHKTVLIGLEGVEKSRILFVKCLTLFQQSFGAC
jgi:hypothetical protein